MLDLAARIVVSIRALPVKGERCAVRLLTPDEVAGFNPRSPREGRAIGGFCVSVERFLVSIRALPVKGERFRARVLDVESKGVSIRALPVKGERCAKSQCVHPLESVSIRALPVKGERYPARTGRRHSPHGFNPRSPREGRAILR